MTHQSLLIEAVRYQLIPHIMHSEGYEEHRKGVNTARNDRFTHNLYHCFRPAVDIDMYDYLEIDVYIDNRITRIEWKNKLIEFWIIGGKQFKTCCNETHGQNAPTQEFATFDDMMDHTMHFVA